ncbi:FAD-dependent monooxygenase [Streptomyces sp. NPDC001401]|uniref:FAD-dependent monooxygenase n=1 Tax=Streptomyces sp. NPDC001401 TaxID=3364570 RepID=UPI00368AB424
MVHRSASRTALCLGWRCSTGSDRRMAMMQPPQASEAVRTNPHDPHARRSFPTNVESAVKHLGQGQVGHVVAERCRMGRVLPAGHAAHGHPLPCGLGSDTVVQRSCNLAGQLALPFLGRAGEALLHLPRRASRQPSGAVRVRQRARTVTPKRCH